MEPQTNEPLLSNMSHNHSEQISPQSFSQHDQLAHHYPANLDAIYASKSTGCLTKVFHPGLSAIKAKSIGNLKLENNIITNETAQVEMFAQHFPTNLDSIYASKSTGSLTKMLHPGLSAIKAKSIGCLKREDSTITDATAQKELKDNKQKSIESLSPTKVRSEIMLDKQSECGRNRSSTPQIKSEGDLLSSQCVTEPVCEQEDIKSTCSNNVECKSNDEIDMVSINKNESKYIENNEIKPSAKSTEVYSQVKLRSVHTMRPKSCHDSEIILSSLKRNTTGNNVVDSTRDHIEDMSNEVQMPTEVALKIKAAEALISKLADSTGILKTKKTPNKENKVNSISPTQDKCIKLKLEIASKEFRAEPCNKEQTDCTGVIKTYTTYGKDTKFHASSIDCEGMNTKVDPGVDSKVIEVPFNGENISTKVDLEASKVITTEYSIRGQTDVSSILKTNSPSKKENEFKASSTSGSVNNKVNLKTSKLITTDEGIREHTDESEILKNRPSIKQNEVKAPSNSENISTKVGLENSEVVATEDCIRQQTDVSNILIANKPSKEEKKVMAPSTSENISTILELEASKLVATENCIREQTDISEVLKIYIGLPSKKEQKAKPIESTSTKVDLEDASKVLEAKACILKTDCRGISKTARKHRSRKETKVAASNSIQGKGADLELEGTSKSIAEEPCIKDKKARKGILTKNEASKNANRVDVASCIEGLSNKLDLDGTSNVIITGECIGDQSKIKQQFTSNTKENNSKTNFSDYPEQLKPESISQHERFPLQYHENPYTVYASKSTGILPRVPDSDLTALKAKSDINLKLGNSTDTNSTRREIIPFYIIQKPTVNFNQLRYCTKVRSEITLDKQKERQKNRASNLETKSDDNLLSSQCVVTCEQENLKNSTSNKSKRKGEEMSVSFMLDKIEDNFREDNVINTSPARIDISSEECSESAHKLKHKSLYEFQNGVSSIKRCHSNRKVAVTSSIEDKGNELHAESVLKTTSAEGYRSDQTIFTTMLKTISSMAKKVSSSLSIQCLSNKENLEDNMAKRSHSFPSIEGLTNKENLEGASKFIRTENSMKDQTNCTKKLKTKKASKKEKKVGASPSIEGMSNNGNLEGASKLISTETSMKDQTDSTKKRKTERSSKKEKKVGASPSIEGTSNKDNLEGASELITTKTFMEGQTDSTKKRKTKRSSKKEKIVGASPSIEGMSNNANSECASNSIRPTAEVTTISDKRDGTRKPKTISASKKETKVSSSSSIEGVGIKENQDSDSKLCSIEIDTTDKIACTGESKTNRSTSKENKISVPPSIEIKGNQLHSEGVPKTITTEGHSSEKIYSTSTLKIISTSEMAKKAYSSPSIEGLRNGEILEEVSNNIATEVAIINDQADCTKKLRTKKGSKKKKKVSASPTAEITIINDETDHARKPKSKSSTRKDKKDSSPSSIKGDGNQENLVGASKCVTAEMPEKDQNDSTSMFRNISTSRMAEKSHSSSSIEGLSKKDYLDASKMAEKAHPSPDIEGLSNKEDLEAREMAKKAHSSSGIEGLSDKEDLEASKMAVKAHSSPCIEGLSNKDNLEASKMAEKAHSSPGFEGLSNKEDLEAKEMAKKAHSSPGIEGLSNKEDLEVSKMAKKRLSSPSIEGICYKGNLESAPIIIKTEVPMEDQTDFAGMLKTNIASRIEKNVSVASNIESLRNNFQREVATKSNTVETNINDQANCIDMLKTISASQKEKKVSASSRIEGIGNKEDLAGASKTIAAEAAYNEKQHNENLSMNAHNEAEKLKQRLRHRKIQTENLRALLRMRENQLCACADDMIHLKTRLLGREKTIIRLCEMFLKLKSQRVEQLYGRPGVSIAWKYGSETVDEQHLF